MASCSLVNEEGSPTRPVGLPSEAAIIESPEAPPSSGGGGMRLDPSGGDAEIEESRSIERTRIGLCPSVSISDGPGAGWRRGNLQVSLDPVEPELGETTMDGTCGYVLSGLNPLYGWYLWVRFSSPVDHHPCRVPLETPPEIAYEKRCSRKCIPPTTPTRH